MAPVERFTSPPPTRSVELTPERAAQVVRSSSNARWVGFLAVVVVVLFITIYWFYELAPLGFREPRLDAEAAAQQVTSVERGYNLYEANCARCHGANGEGGIGPALNRQDKLFAHLSVDYLNNMMIAGGRYACGNPNSIMPIWSNEGRPAGPLNYIQIEDLIAFIRAPSNETYTSAIPPRTSRSSTRSRTRSRRSTAGSTSTTSRPRARRRSRPAGRTSSTRRRPRRARRVHRPPRPEPRRTGASAEASAPCRRPVHRGRRASGGAAVRRSRSSRRGSPGRRPTWPTAGAPFDLSFDNEDAGTPHNFTLKDSTGAVVFKTATFPGVATRTSTVPALAAGTYPFVCTVHPTMTGTLTAK